MLKQTFSLAGSRYLLQLALCVGLVLPLTLARPVSARVAQREEASPTLEAGQLVERELAGGQAHSYHITLAARQFLRAVAEQRGIDVVATLFGPDGRQIIEVDSPNGRQGPETVSLIIEDAGTYRLEIRSLKENVPPGRYALKVEELRPVTTQDRSRVAAETASREAGALRAQGTPDSLRAAVKKYEEAVSHYGAAGEHHNQGRLQNRIGELYGEYLGDKKKALESYKLALSFWRAAGQSAGQAISLYLIGTVNEELGDPRAALDSYEQALRLFQEANELTGQAGVLNNMAAVYGGLGDKRRALEHLERSLPLWEALGNASGHATALNNIGGLYRELGEPRKALHHLEKSLPLWQATEKPINHATALYLIGAIYEELGEGRKALDSYRRTLPFYQGDEHRHRRANVFNNIGRMFSTFGERQNALDNYTQALSLWRAINDRLGQATALNSIGMLYKGIGDGRRAREYFEQALPLWRGVEDANFRATMLNNMGAIFADLGDAQKALDTYAEALALHQSTEDRGGQAAVFNNMGSVYIDSGERQKAVESFVKALTLFQATGDRRGQATMLNNLGWLYDRLGDKAKALDSYTQALSFWSLAEDRRGRAATLANMALAKRDGGMLTEALNNIEEALSIVESLRTEIGSQELRTSYFATVQGSYDFYINLLMRLHRQQPSAGYDRAAMQGSERARARGLLELLNEARVGIRRGVDPELAEQERSLRRRLAAKMQQLQGRPNNAKASEALAREVEDLLSESRQVETRIRQSNPHYAALTQPRPLNAREIQTQVLDADTLMLRYSLGPERSYLWAVTQTSFTSHELPRRTELEAAAKHFHDLVAARGAATESAVEDREVAEAASRLSRMLLGPVASQLGTKRLLIVADGALHYVPFAALPDPAAAARGPRRNQPLLVRHEVVSLPSASVLPSLRAELRGRVPAPRTLAVLADPVFSAGDKRFDKVPTGALNGRARLPQPQAGVDGGKLEEGEAPPGALAAAQMFTRLPGTLKEAQRILALVPANQAHVALGFDANRALAVSGELRHYRHILFATHGQLDDLRPELSSVVLSLVDEGGNPQDGYLRLNDIFNLDLPADLVVLSGCRTALGKEVRGEGLVGLTRGFMYAGAPRVVASLWQTDDEATAELMERFYRGMLREGMRPAAALRAAQIGMLRQPRWQAPHYWAAFVLQGEWR